MKKCSNCGFENEDVSIFCSECGAKFAEKTQKNVEVRFCKNCGSAVEPGALFCGECGKSLQAQASPAPAPVDVEKNEGTTQKKLNIVPIIVAVVLVLVLGVGIFFVSQSGVLDGILSGNDEEIEENMDKDDEEEIEETEEVDEEVEEEDIVEVDTTKPLPLTATVSASSALNETYNVEALTDGDVSTVWAEGVGGYGEGEYITYAFQSDVYVYGIAILPGDLTSSSSFYSNAYPTELEVSNGDTAQIISIAYYTPSFNFAGNPYLFYTFSEPVCGDNITVTINAVKKGASGQMTCITEMHLFTYPEVGSDVAVDETAWAVTVGDVTTGDYILPTSNSAYLTMEDLEGFTAEDCRLARNELYARYGRKFTDETLRAYFEAKEWYEGTIEPDDFTEDMLNEYELYNRDLIVEYEEANGFR